MKDRECAKFSQVVLNAVNEKWEDPVFDPDKKWGESFCSLLYQF